MPSNKEIGYRLKELRKSKRLSRKIVANDLGITRSALGNYESGTSVPRDEIKIRIADYYGKQVQEIFLTNMFQNETL